MFEVVRSCVKRVDCIIIIISNTVMRVKILRTLMPSHLNYAALIFRKPEEFASQIHSEGRWYSRWMMEGKWSRAPILVFGS